MATLASEGALRSEREAGPHCAGLAGWGGRLLLQGKRLEGVKQGVGVVSLSDSSLLLAGSGIRFLRSVTRQDQS